MFRTHNADLIPEQLSAAEEFFREYADDIARGHTIDNFVDYDKTTEIRQRGQKLFGVFGSTAYELHSGRFDNGDGGFAEWEPLLVNSALILESPDEGRSGVAHLIRITNPRRNPNTCVWCAQFLPCGWLHTDELNRSDAQILGNIIDEVDDGQTPLTGGGLPGWV